MPFFSRNKQTLLSRWWWSLDKPLVGFILLLFLIGLMIVSTASPMVCVQHGWAPAFFIRKHLVFCAFSMLALLLFSLASQVWIRRFFFGLFPLLMLCLIWLALQGGGIKGASRWISLAGFSFQPSEFLKPCFAVLTAFSFEKAKQDPHHSFWLPWVNGFLLFISMLLLLKQPDLGMMALLGGSWAIQAFVAGVPYLFFVLGSGLMISILGTAYLFFPHVTQRIDTFLHPEKADKYGAHFQITQSLECFATGKGWGVGLGEGLLKRTLPDAHADFILAVAAEEMGFAFCLFLLCLYAAIFLRFFIQAEKQLDLFNRLVIWGLLGGLILQMVVNIASVTYLIPPKGVTLPGISYGGSSLINVGISFGVALALLPKHTSGYRFFKNQQ